MARATCGTARPTNTIGPAAAVAAPHSSTMQTAPRIRERPIRYEVPPPLLGQHTRAVLGGVLGLDGAPLTLRSLWTDRPAVLVFVRHFGCLFCKEQVADVLPEKAPLGATGPEIGIVGKGSVGEARAVHARWPILHARGSCGILQYRGAGHPVARPAAPRVGLAGCCQVICASGRRGPASCRWQATR